MGVAPARAAGDEGRILHASSFVGAVRRIDHRELRVGIRPIPFVEALHAALGHVQVALPRTLVAVVGEQPNLDRTDAAVELIFHDFEVGIGGPGKVVDIFGVEGDGLGTIAVVGVAGLHARGADHVILRQRDLHVIGAEVGEELGHGVELMAIPSAVPPHADLGKPLSGEQEGALVAGARNHLRKGRLELDLELHILAGRDRRAATCTSKTVLSSGLPSSGEMNFICLVRSPMPTTSNEVTSFAP